MNRRGFIQVLVGLVAVPALVLKKIDAAPPGRYRDQFKRVPGYTRFASIENWRFIESPPEPDQWADFDPSARYAEGLNLEGDPGPVALRVARRLLTDKMEQSIPPIYRQYVEWYGPIKIDYGRAVSLAWRYG